MLPATLGSQVSSPLERPLCPLSSFGEMGCPGWDAGGRHIPTREKATKQACPLPCPWILAEGPSCDVAPSPFYGCSHPLTGTFCWCVSWRPNILPSSALLRAVCLKPVHEVVPILEPCSPESMWGSARKEPGSSRHSLNRAQIPS